MKSLRRSLNKDHPQISTPLSTYPVNPKPLGVTQPPQKVIRALQSYRAQSPQEVSFTKGEFLYVNDETERYYEAHSTLNGARGFVPRQYFEEVNRARPITQISSNPAQARPPLKRHQTFYAIVQYDFIAERPDELDAKAGEPISVVAQSNREWFVAKPIGRLGGPGLIPVAFVEIRDPATGKPVPDVNALMDRGDLPRVEEWKQATAEYKASSIPLGVLEEPAAQQPNTKPTIPHQHPAPEEQLLPPGSVISATIPSFHYENDEYWFRINAIYQPDDQPSPSLSLILYRNYDDFYDFQISLLDAFPKEAGRETNAKLPPTPPGSDENGRILPYMPGPVSYVDDMITSVRRTELDEYLDQLCGLGSYGAQHVLRHHLVRRFFSPKPGDMQDEVEVEAPVPKTHQQQDELNNVPLSNLRLQDEHPGRSSGENSDHESRAGARDYSHPSSRPQSTTEGGVPYPGQGTSGFYPSDPQSNYTNHSHTPSHSYSYSQGHASLSPPNSQGNHPYGTNASRPPSMPHSSSARSSANVGNPTYSIPSVPNPSGNNSRTSDPPFLKIKIFHSESDDLIAIRVPPKVTYSQLITKVRDRLGAGVGQLKYRNSMGQAAGDRSWREIESDEDLKEWISKGDKLVLYAD